MSVWLWFSRCWFINPYNFKISTKHDFLSFEIFVSKFFEGWKERHLYGRPRAALSLATSLVGRPTTWEGQTGNWSSRNILKTFSRQFWMQPCCWVISTLFVRSQKMILTQQYNFTFYKGTCDKPKILYVIKTEENPKDVSAVTILVYSWFRCTFLQWN